MKDVRLPDSTVEQLREYQRRDESRADALRRLLRDAEPAPEAAPEPEELAERCLTVSDLRQMEETGYDPVELLAERYDVHPDDYASEADMREALHEKRREDDER